MHKHQSGCVTQELPTQYFHYQLDMNTLGILNLGCSVCRSNGAALAACPAPRTSEHQSDQGAMAVNAVESLQSVEGDPQPAAASEPKCSAKQLAGMPTAPPGQLGGVSDTPNPDKARISALTDAQVQTWLENVTGAQLEACMENAQRIEGNTGGLSPPQVGAVQADPNPAPSVAQSIELQAGALPATASQAAATAADDRSSSVRQGECAAAGASQAGGSPPQVGVLLVSGGHVQQWLAATNMVSEHSSPNGFFCTCKPLRVLRVFTLVLVSNSTGCCNLPSSA